VRPQIGLTLPTFVDDPDVLVAVARAADASGIDAVFTYDHLYRIASDADAPSLALEPVLGTLAVETERVRFGSFMARATIRPPAVLRSVFDTVARVAPGRLIAGVGAGDALSDPENEMFGLPTDEPAARLAALAATVEALAGRGYPIWVGGRSDRVIGVAAALADGWNAWNVDQDEFTTGVARLRAAAQREERAVAVTWGGLVELRESRWPEAAERDDVLVGPFDAMAERLRAFVDAGAQWIVLAPIAPADRDNAAVVAEAIAPALG